MWAPPVWPLGCRKGCPSTAPAPTQVTCDARGVSEGDTMPPPGKESLTGGPTLCGPLQKGGQNYSDFKKKLYQKKVKTMSDF